MVKRKVSTLELFACLELGRILRTPEGNIKKGSLECRMERYVAGRDLTVVVALCDEDPDAITVTVF